MMNCPYCGSGAIEIAPERATEDHETAFCSNCGWVGFEDELEES
jgi:transcription elongation factor Elf1